VGIFSNHSNQTSLFIPTVLFGGAGALSYLTFGAEVKAVVLVNLDQTSKLTQSVSTPWRFRKSYLISMLRNKGPVPILACYPAFYTPPVFPRRSNSRERTLCAKRKAKPACQMDQEPLPLWARGAVHRA